MWRSILSRCCRPTRSPRTPGTLLLNVLRCNASDSANPGTEDATKPKPPFYKLEPPVKKTFVAPVLRLEADLATLTRSAPVSNIT